VPLQFRTAVSLLAVELDAHIWQMSNAARPKTDACTVGDAVYLNEQTQHVSNACDRALLMLECTLKNRQHVG